MCCRWKSWTESGRGNTLFSTSSNLVVSHDLAAEAALGKCAMRKCTLNNASESQKQHWDFFIIIYKGESFRQGITNG